MSKATQKMVQSVSQESPTQFQKQFNDNMLQRVGKALTMKKLEVASTMIMPNGATVDGKKT